MSWMVGPPKRRRKGVTTDGDESWQAGPRGKPLIGRIFHCSLWNKAIAKCKFSAILCML